MAMVRFRRSQDVVFEMSGARALLLDSSGDQLREAGPVVINDAAD